MVQSKRGEVFVVVSGLVEVIEEHLAHLVHWNCTVDVTV